MRSVGRGDVCEQRAEPVERAYRCIAIFMTQIIVQAKNGCSAQCQSATPKYETGVCFCFFSRRRGGGGWTISPKRRLQVGVEDYFKLGKHKARPLNNPLAAEFGIYDERQLDEFILNHLPGFALVRALCLLGLVSRASCAYRCFCSPSVE